jgi:hypothetical protein
VGLPGAVCPKQAWWALMNTQYKYLHSPATEMPRRPALQMRRGPGALGSRPRPARRLHGVQVHGERMGACMRQKLLTGRPLHRPALTSMAFKRLQRVIVYLEGSSAAPNVHILAFAGIDVRKVVIALVLRDILRFCRAWRQQAIGRSVGEQLGVMVDEGAILAYRRLSTHAAHLRRPSQRAQLLLRAHRAALGPPP